MALNGSAHDCVPAATWPGALHNQVTPLQDRTASKCPDAKDSGNRQPVVMSDQGPLSRASSRSFTTAAFERLTPRAPGCVAPTNDRMIQPNAVPWAVPVLVPTLMNEPIGRRIAAVFPNCFQRNTAN